MDYFLDAAKNDCIAVDIDELLIKLLEMKKHGKTVALLSIMEPQEDEKIRKNLDIDAIGNNCGGVTDYGYIQCVTKEEFDKAFWFEWKSNG